MKKDEEALYEAYERFEGLLCLCPHHTLQHWMIIQAFYNGVTWSVRSTIDAVTRGTLMNKTEDKAYNLIEEMALNNFQWSTECGQLKRVGGKLEVDAHILLSTKVHAMTQRLDHINVNTVKSSAHPLCEICGSIEHATLKCQVGGFFFPRL